MRIRDYLTTFLVLITLFSVAERALSESEANARAIQADLQRVAKEKQWRLAYVNLDPYVGAARKELEASIKFMVCQTSLAPVMERILPQPIPGTTLLRMDLLELGWKQEDWHTILRNYPYWDFERHKVPPYDVRADWLLLQLADQNESDAYFRLLFGGDSQPKNRDEFLQKLGVFNRREHVFGLIEGQSGVAQQGTRWLESRPVLRGYAWGTRDTNKLVSKNDPLENPDGSQVHQAEEWIIGAPLLSETGIRGVRFIFGLSNGQGELQTKAPVDIVQDFTNFRGYPEIRNPGSCIQCHQVGYNLPTLNEYKALVESGIIIPSVVNNEKLARELAAFHFSDAIKEITRANEDYQVLVTLQTGLESKELSEAFKRTIDRYVARLDLTTAAEEFVPQGYEVADFTRALTEAANQGVIGARLSSFLQNGRMPREAWEEQYVRSERIIRRWGKQ